MTSRIAVILGLLLSGSAFAGADAGSWSQYPAGALQLGAMVEGPTSASMWAADPYGHSLEYISKDGTKIGHIQLVAKIAGKRYPFQPFQLAVGADQRFYAGGLPCVILAVTSGGKAQTSSPITSGDCPAGTLALGPDGNVWFPERTHVANVSVTGTITEFALSPKVDSKYGYNSVAAGADGRVWFTFQHGNIRGYSSYVVAITQNTGALNYYYPALQKQCAQMSGLALAQDGNLYTVCTQEAAPYSQSLVSITAHGTFSYYPLALGAGAATRGPDGNVWFGDFSGGVVGYGIFDVTTHTSTNIPSPYTTSGAFNVLANGPNGSVWATQGGINSSTPTYFVRYTPG